MPQGHVLHCVYSGLICNRQKLESTQMSLDRRMDTENVVLLPNGILFSYLKLGIMNFAGQWMELENILSEVTQTQKDMLGMHSLMRTQNT